MIDMVYSKIGGTLWWKWISIEATDPSKGSLLKSCPVLRRKWKVVSTQGTVAASVTIPKYIYVYFISSYWMPIWVRLFRILPDHSESFPGKCFLKKETEKKILRRQEYFWENIQEDGVIILRQ